MNDDTALTTTAGTAFDIITGSEGTTGVLRGGAATAANRAKMARGTHTLSTLQLQLQCPLTEAHLNSVLQVGSETGAMYNAIRFQQA